MEKATTAVQPAEAKSVEIMSIDKMKSWYNQLVEATKIILKKDLDYGEIPNVKKPSLFKPGAEKLRLLFGLGAEISLVDKTENFDIEYYDYTYKAVIRDRADKIIAECEGNCNSFEPKFKYKKGKGELIGLKNTLIKMAQKRAFVGAILIATGASEFYTQDIEDLTTFDLQGNPPAQSATQPAAKPVKATVTEVKATETKDDNLLQTLERQLSQAANYKTLREIGGKVNDNKDKITEQERAKLLIVYSQRLSELKAKVKGKNNG